MPETIGLDIGSHTIKLVGLKMKARGPLLTRARCKEIPRGGEAGDENLIAETLKALYREAGLKPGKVNLIASGGGTNIRFLSLPSMPKSELPEAIRWEIRSQLPFPVETARIDFYTLGEVDEEGVKKIQLIAAACPSPLIDRTLSIAEKSGLQPAHLDVTPFALWNALLTFHRLEKEEGVVLIDLGAEKTGIHIFPRGVLKFSREVTPAGKDITQAIMDGIEPGEDPPHWNERAEKIKRDIGIGAGTSSEKVEGEAVPVSKISFLIRPVLEKLSAEISRSLDYYMSQFPGEHIHRVLLTGGGAHLKNVASYLTGELHLPVECLNPFKGIPFDTQNIEPRVFQEMGPRFTAAMGVALATPHRVELLPAKEPYWSKARVEKLIPAFSLMAAFLIFLGIFGYMYGQAAPLRRERDEKVNRLKSLDALQARMVLLKSQENEKRSALSFYQSSLISSIPSREILRAIRHIVPSNVTVTLLEVPEPARPLRGETKKNPAFEGRELQISGMAFGNNLQCLTALAQLIERLENERLFKNTQLTKAEENKLYNQPGFEFAILCDLDLEKPLREGKAGTHGIKK